MRILFDSRQLIHKDPFGTLVPGQICTLRIHVPDIAMATGIQCRFRRDDGGDDFSVTLNNREKKGSYTVYEGAFSFRQTGLYFYHFYVHKADGGFRLFKSGSGTNMESGDLW